MGWINDDAPGHEGYTVGLVEVETAVSREAWRELGYRWGDETRRAVRRVQAGCDCGWRSRVFVAPARADWSPYSVELHDEQAEEALCLEWRRHIDSEARAEREERDRHLTPVQP